MADLPKATSEELAWSSSNEDIGTVDENGLVTGITPGEATITATSVKDQKILDSKIILVTNGKSDITSFTINGVKGVIDGININVMLPDSTDVKSLKPDITHTGSSINPGAKIAQDFTNPVVYTVMGEDGSTLKWTVSVSTGTIDENNHGAFVTTWDAQEIAIPTEPNFEYDYSVDWNNDGNIDESGITGNITHTFEDDGEHTIRITGIFLAIQFGSLSQEEAAKIIFIDQWGTNEWLSMSGVFQG